MVHFVTMLLTMFINHNLKSDKTFTSDVRTSMRTKFKFFCEIMVTKEVESRKASQSTSKR